MNHGSLASEATTLPTEPQPLPAGDINLIALLVKIFKKLNVMFNITNKICHKKAIYIGNFVLLLAHAIQYPNKHGRNIRK